MEFAALRAVAVGEVPSAWSERLPTPPELRRYAEQGAWCAPDAREWREAAGTWTRFVAVPATGAVHLAVWAALLPVEGFGGWAPLVADLRTASPPSPAELVRLAGRRADGRPRGRLGASYVAVLVCLAAPAYALVAVLARPGRLLAAVPAAAALAALLLR